jgi:hypothetical protein
VVWRTPDKDLAQCVRGSRIVQLNRRTRVTLDEAGVVQKFGVSPASIPPDYHEWHVNAANASALAATLSRERDRALLFRTLRTDIALFDHVDQLR